MTKSQLSLSRLPTSVNFMEAYESSYKDFKDEYFWIFPRKRSLEHLFQVVGKRRVGKDLFSSRFPLYWTGDDYNKPVKDYKTLEESLSKMWGKCKAPFFELGKKWQPKFLPRSLILNSSFFLLRIFLLKGVSVLFLIHIILLFHYFIQRLMYLLNTRRFIIGRLRHL